MVLFIILRIYLLRQNFVIFLACFNVACFLFHNLYVRQRKACIKSVAIASLPFSFVIVNICIICNLYS